MMHDELRRAALSHPQVTEGLSCAGTALETPTFEVRKKAFLFLGREVARLKLKASVAEAEGCPWAEVGKHGWVKVKLAEAPPEVLSRWIGESYGLFAKA